MDLRISRNMNQIFEFFSRLFDVSDWPPRWYCGYWSEFHGWLYILSDLAIWLSYFAIPVFLLVFIYKKPDVPLPRVFWLFGLFILACGLTHLMDAIIFWWPAYRLSALIRFVTACVSLATVVALYRIFPKALKLTTSTEYNRELTRRMEAEQELQDANQLLQAKSKEVERLAYMVSHDLKAPVNSFIQLTELAQARVNELGDEELKENLSYLRKSADRMRSTINNLLDYAAIGKSAELKTTDINVILSAVLQDLQSVIVQKGAKIKLTGNFPTLDVYPNELRLLFQNLISNALKFQPEGNIPEVEISALEQDKHWQFAVRDNGIGIPPELAENIFGLFERLHSRSKYEGTGLGLAHSRKIVEMHGGRIWVEPRPDCGSIFYFTISKSLAGQRKS
ncbi:MAG: hypothetical protein Kow0075_00330 [Salibacteraceae bacterium]